MIAGIGIDIVEIERIRTAVDKWGNKFLKRIFSEHEISYCFSKRDPFLNLAGRFAAKEAAVKALSGLAGYHDINVGDIEVLNNPSGKPYVVFAEGINSHISNTVVLHISLSHERSYAIATVIAERKSS
ncbi:MAG: holo-ACP synthase [Dissulfurispiraceae bacterium]|jgi:holo-[acyl-carrier protein] synthase